MTVFQLTQRCIVSMKCCRCTVQPLKALVHEKFGDGIISAINFKLDVKKVADPEGGERAVITLDGKYLPTKPF